MSPLQAAYGLMALGSCIEIAGKIYQHKDSDIAITVGQFCQNMTAVFLAAIASQRLFASQAPASLKTGAKIILIPSLVTLCGIVVFVTGFAPCLLLFKKRDLHLSKDDWKAIKDCRLASIKIVEENPGTEAQKKKITKNIETIPSTNVYQYVFKDKIAERETSYENNSRGFKIINLSVLIMTFLFRKQSLLLTLEAGLLSGATLKLQRNRNYLSEWYQAVTSAAQRKP